MKMCGDGEVGSVVYNGVDNGLKWLGQLVVTQSKIFKNSTSRTGNLRPQPRILTGSELLRRSVSTRHKNISTAGSQ